MPEFSFPPIGASGGAPGAPGFYSGGGQPPADLPPLSHIVLAPPVGIAAVPLTPSYLERTVAPLLRAIEKLQVVCNLIQKKSEREVVIASITHRSPVMVALQGAIEALSLMRDMIIPWRRQNAERISRLKEQQISAEIAAKSAEALDTRARGEAHYSLADKLSAEAELTRAQANQVRTETKKLSLDLEKQRIELALSIIERLAPKLPSEERIAYVIRLLGPIEHISNSELEVIFDDPHRVFAGVTPPASPGVPSSSTEDDPYTEIQ